MSMLFGTFIIQKGLCTSTQVVRALDMQYARRRPPAQVAIEMGVLDARQTLDALNEERASGQHFLRVVERLGFASPEDVRRVEQSVQQSGPRLGDILVELGALTHGELERALAQYRAEGL